MVEFLLNNEIVPTGVTNWEDLTIKASFNDEEIEAIVDIQDATFSGREAEIIKQWVEDGLNGYRGIYQGLPLSMRLYDNNNSIQAFEGYLNLKEKFTQVNDCEIITSINSKDDLLTIQEKLQSINFGALLDQGLITPKDFVTQYFIVDKYEAGAEFMLLSIALFLTLKETIEASKALGVAFTNVIKAATPNAGFPSVDLGDIISASILALLDAIYVALMINYLIQLLRDLLDFTYPPKRKYLGMSLYRLLEVTANKLGYKLETGIEELKNIIYIPSRPDEKADRSGIPRPSDRGYNCSEIVGIVKDLFDAVLTVDGDKLIIRAKKDPYWIKNSSYIMPDTLYETLETNANEIVGNKLLTFETDPVDAWTSVNYKGTSYSIRTLAKNNDTEDLINGFSRIDFNIALADRKNGLTDLEKTLKFVAGLIDGLINFFGGKSNLAAKIENRVGMIKQSGRTISVPKLVKIGSDGKLVNRDLFSAKYLYDNYHNYESFVLNNYNGQKRVFREVKIKFCLEDFIKTKKNSYFTLYDGRVGKFTSITWNFSKDEALASFWIREPHSKNLIEEYAEPE